MMCPTIVAYRILMNQCINESVMVLYDRVIVIVLVFCRLPVGSAS